jgi:hypothetical protein
MGNAYRSPRVAQRLSTLITRVWLPRRYKLHNVGWPVQESFYFLTAGDAGQYQHCFHTTFGAGDNIRIHAITDHHYIL